MEIIKLLNTTNGDRVGELKHFVVTEKDNQYKTYQVNSDTYYKLNEGDVITPDQRTSMKTETKDTIKEFVSVQPMNLPSGLVFYLNLKYGSVNGANPTDKSGSYYHSQDRTNHSTNKRIKS